MQPISAMATPKPNPTLDLSNEQETYIYAVVCLLSFSFSPYYPFANLSMWLIEATPKANLSR